MSFRLTTQLNNTEFTPGDTLRGAAEWDGDGPATVSLQYFTRGRGREDATLVAEQKLPPGGHAEFSFALPAQPYSFNGPLGSLVWALELASTSRSDTCQLEFTLSATGKPVTLTEVPRQP